MNITGKNGNEIPLRVIPPLQPPRGIYLHLQPSSKGTRVTFSAGKRTVIGHCRAPGRDLAMRFMILLKADKNTEAGRPTGGSTRWPTVGRYRCR
jgi:hypothetical protein